MSAIPLVLQKSFCILDRKFLGHGRVFHPRMWDLALNSPGDFGNLSRVAFISEFEKTELESAGISAALAVVT